MKALLMTQCGCSRLIDITERSKELTIKLNKMSNISPMVDDTKIFAVNKSNELMETRKFTEAGIEFTTDGTNKIIVYKEV